MLLRRATATAVLTLATTLGAQEPAGSSVVLRARQGFASPTAPHLFPLEQPDLCRSTAGAYVATCAPGVAVNLAASAAPGGVLRARAAVAFDDAVLTPRTAPATPPANALLFASALVDQFDQLTFAGEVPAVIRFSFALSAVLRGAPAGGMSSFESEAVLFFGSTQGAGAPSLTSVLGDRLLGTAADEEPVSLSGFRDVAVVGSSPLRWTLRLTSRALAFSAFGAALDGSVDADASNTAYLGVQALDAAGNDVTARAGLRFASGAQYATSVLLPEPGTWALLGTGLLAVGGVAARRKRTMV